MCAHERIPLIDSTYQFTDCTFQGGAPQLRLRLLHFRKKKMKRIPCLRRLKAWLLHIDRRQRDSGFQVVRSSEHHTCPFCGEEYEGNFCPQCGLEPELKYVTWRSSVPDFLNIWNLGSSAVFRTMKHLLWRPGYMINDWLNGRRQLYFSPVLSLVTACFIFGLCMYIRGLEFPEWDDVVELGVDTDSATVARERADSLLLVRADSIRTAHADSLLLTPSDSLLLAQADSLQLAIDSRPTLTGDELIEHVAIDVTQRINDLLAYYDAWSNEHYAYSLMLSKLILMIVLPLCFRRTPRRPHTSMPEFFFALLYLDAALILVASVYVLLTGELLVSGYFYPMPNWLSVPLLILALRQLFGYSLWGTTWRFGVIVLCMYAIFFIVIFCLLLSFAFQSGVAAGAAGG